MFRPLLTLLLCLALGITAGRADIVINEVVTSGSDRLLRYDSNGIAKLGVGASWYENAYSDSMWETGPGPFGFGPITGGPALGTNTQTRMQYLTPTLYLRKTFNVTAAQAALADALELVTQYNDGIIVFVNGVEVSRRRAGPAGQFNYHDMPAGDPDYNNANGDSQLYSETLNLGAANARLVAGQNVIAVHALNISSTQGAFLFSGNLRIGGASPISLVNANDTWKFFPGVVEPSGGLFDPTLTYSGRLSVPWGTTVFDDTTWSTGNAPLGVGIAGVATTTPGVVGVTPSIYIRKVFNISAAEAASTAALQLVVNADDGFVAYVNGVEVDRANLSTPNTFIPRTAVASAAGNFSTNDTTTIDPAVVKLVPGNNVLAVQVHNVTINDADIGIRASLQRVGGTTYVPLSTSWRYKIGTTEPVEDLDGAIEDNPDAPESINDWVELHNNGASPVSLLGWALTDDKTEPAKWTFPDISIPAGAYLVVMCDGLDIKNPAPGGFLHANFSLSGDGEYFALVNPSGAVVQQFNPGLPAGSPFHSYGRTPSNNYVYFDTPTPGAANAGAQFQGRVSKPVFNVPGGIYSAAQTVQLTSSTPGATIRYTTNGSEPTETTGTAATSISVTTAGGRNGRAYRARAFAPGFLPSDVVSHTYIIQASPAVTLPVVALSGDETRSLYRPFGIFAIKENAAANYPLDGNGNATAWSALGDPLQYNNANYRGQFMERPVNWSMLYPNSAPGFTFDIGLRPAGSPFTRPRYRLNPQNSTVNPPNTGMWGTSSGGQTDRPSMNFYMRNHYGGDPLDFPVITGSPVTKHSDFRFRAGHNDLNPFIVDELMRRLHVGTGQQGSLGINVMLYVNGIYKNIYNLCQHVREEWLQQAYNSDLEWDVLQVAVPSDGDLIAYQELFTFLRNNPQSTLANYQGAAQRIDLVNFADYILLNVYGATGDWPHNNWIAARERSTTGKWRFFTWDAEGAFGGFSNNTRTNSFSPASPNTTAHGVVVTSGPTTDGLNYGARAIYSMLRSSPEFKLLMADRIQKHFFNGGTLANTAILGKNTTLANEVSGFIGGYNANKILDWVRGTGTNVTLADGNVARNASGSVPSRRQVLLHGYVDETAGNVSVPAHFTQEGIWPATKAPVFSQHGGNVGANFQLTITNPNGAGSEIYYTVNGTDPRVEGGAINGTLYTGPVTLNQTLTVKARVRTTGGAWSPVTEALFVSTVAPPLLITEIMYHPPDFDDNGTIVNGNEFEFIELKNISPQPYGLFGLRFTDGIEYAFPAGSTLPANGFVVIPKNPTMFAKKYPNVPTLGGYGPASALNNAGENIRLEDAAGNVIVSVPYDDEAPWPVDADGDGPSLVPMFPNTNPDPTSATNWRLSGSPNGSPGTDDPAAGIPLIRITEVLANSDGGAGDAIELFNPGAEDANIGGWFLSDDLGTPKKYRIPDNTMVPAGSYLVFTEAQFGVGPNAFALSSNGDEAVLSSADPVGELTGLTEFVSFGPSETNVSFGRHTVTSDTTPSYSRPFFVPMAAQTFGAANGTPKISPVIITEVQYHPTFGLSEFIELRNNSGHPVPLFDPANPSNTWRVSGINFAIPAGITLQPGQFLVIASIPPAEFRASPLNVPQSVLVVGPYQPEDLANTGERVVLQKPGAPYIGSSGQTIVPYIDVDVVTYGQAPPWITPSSGASLERYNFFGFGEDPDSWKNGSSVGGNPGRLSSLTFANWQTKQWFVGEPGMQGHLADPDGDGLVNAMEFFMGLNPRARDSHLATAASVSAPIGGEVYLTISFRQAISASGTTFQVEGGSDLINWTQQTNVVGSAVDNGDGTRTVTYRDSVPMDENTRRFLRVKAVVP